ncbi:MAG: MGMT family protein [Muribaculaceae bacterium]|nr:MGMT family protein [Muribaculaceae bacterium]
MAQDKISSMEFTRSVQEVVSAIPEGKVLTYGDVAALAGAPGHARQVGRILGCFGFESSVPCHRVVNSEGRIAPHWPEQKNLLAREGVAFSSSARVDMRRHRWHPEEEFY